jgi:1,4-dihydroxy-2-naphthoate polyprenyltransferase
MGRLAVAEGVRRAGDYPHAVLCFVGPDGYPVNVAAAFRADAAAGIVELGPLTSSPRPAPGQEVGLLFSHVRPQPGVGYDERRYVNLRGRASPGADTVSVAVEAATGWDEAETPFFEYAERTLPAGRQYLDELGRRPRLSKWWTFFLATRLPFLTATIVPVALGGAVAASHDAFGWGWFLLAMAGGIAVHLGLNMANDLFDDASGADAANVTPTPFSGGSRVLQYGLVRRPSLVAACVAAYATAIVIGLYLAAARTPWLLAVGAVGVVLSVAYTAPPLRLVHRGLGELTTAIGFGPTMVAGTYLACADKWSWEAVYASLPVALLIGLVLLVNEVPDRAGDAAAGKRTLPVRWPKDRIVGLYGGTAGVAFALVVAGVAGVMPVWTLLFLLAAPIALRVWRGLRDHYDRPYGLMPTMQANIGLHLLAGLLLTAGYVVDALLN